MTVNEVERKKEDCSLILTHIIVFDRTHKQTNKQKQTLREKEKEIEREIDEAERVECKYV